MSSEPQETTHYRYLMELDMKTKRENYSNDTFPRFGHCVGYQCYKNVLPQYHLHQNRSDSSTSVTSLSTLT